MFPNSFFFIPSVNWYCIIAHPRISKLVYNLTNVLFILRTSPAADKPSRVISSLKKLFELDKPRAYLSCFTVFMLFIYGRTRINLQKEIFCRDWQQAKLLQVNYIDKLVEKKHFFVYYHYAFLIFSYVQIKMILIM